MSRPSSSCARIRSIATGRAVRRTGAVCRPVQRRTRRVAIRAVFGHMFSQCESPRFRVTERVADGEVCYLRWTFTFRQRPAPALDRQRQQVRFGADDPVEEHFDYWDPAAQLCRIDPAARRHAASVASPPFRRQGSSPSTPIQPPRHVDYDREIRTMTTATNEANGAYRIGAVARLTGISPDTLRIWERRYDIVEPERTPRAAACTASRT